MTPRAKSGNHQAIFRCKFFFQFPAHSLQLPSSHSALENRILKAFPISLEQFIDSPPSLRLPNIVADQVPEHFLGHVITSASFEQKDPAAHSIPFQAIGIQAPPIEHTTKSIRLPDVSTGLLFGARRLRWPFSFL